MALHSRRDFETMLMRFLDPLRKHYDASCARIELVGGGAQYEN